MTHSLDCHLSGFSRHFLLVPPGLGFSEHRLPRLHRVNDPSPQPRLPVPTGRGESRAHMQGLWFRRRPGGREGAASSLSPESGL